MFLHEIQGDKGMTFVEFKEAKIIAREIARKKGLYEKIKEKPMSGSELKNWWIKYTKTKEFKRLYGDKIPVDPWNYYSKENVWKRMKQKEMGQRSNVL